MIDSYYVIMICCSLEFESFYPKKTQVNAAQFVFIQSRSIGLILITQTFVVQAAKRFSSNFSQLCFYNTCLSYDLKESYDLPNYMFL